jgi:hypothetical protein
MRCLYFWGDTSYGKTGLGCTSDNRAQPSPALVRCVFPSMPTQIACGAQHTLIVTESGVLFGLGKSDDSQLGTAETTSALKPRPIPGVKGVQSCAAGPLHSAAVTHTGEVFTWGEDVDGVLGHGSNGGVRYSGISGSSVCQPAYLRALQGVRVTKIGSGRRHMMAMSDKARVYTWGCGLLGRLGHGDVANRATPVMVEALVDLDIANIACGAAHSLAAATAEDGRLFGWGSNDRGQLGLPWPNVGEEGAQMAPHMALSPDSVVGPTTDWNAGGIVGMACGMSHTVLLTGTSMYAMGDNRYGQLGLDLALILGGEGGTDGWDDRRSARDYSCTCVVTVVPLPNGSCASSASCGDWHTALAASGGGGVGGRNLGSGAAFAIGFGRNNKGQLGTGVGGAHTGGPIPTVIGFGSGECACVFSGGSQTAALVERGGLTDEEMGGMDRVSECIEDHEGSVQNWRRDWTFSDYIQHGNSGSGKGGGRGGRGGRDGGERRGMQIDIGNRQFVPPAMASSSYDAPAR